MSRAGYSDDCDDPLQEGRWRAAVNSAIRGKRGQAFLREALAALDAMADKKLIAGDLVVTGSQAACGEDQIIVGSCCLLGAVAVARKMDVSDLDPEDIESTASRFGLADAMTREIVYWNDEGGIGRKVPIPNVRNGQWDCWGYTWLPETPEDRWVRMRAWIEAKITKATLTR